MKKFITAAAFLAASTALASAATVVYDELKTWDGFSAGDYTSLETAVTPSDTGSISFTGGQRVQFDISSLNLDFSSKLYQFTLALSNWTNANGPLISWGLSTGTGTNTVSQKYGFGYSTADGGKWAATQDGNGMSVKGESASATITPSTRSGTLTITVGTDDAGTSAINVVFASSTSDSYTLMDNVAMTFESGESIKFLTLGGWTTGSGNSSTATVASMSISQVSTIPEPSAFGLLAGVGTLALVAARRRRSRKAA